MKKNTNGVIIEKGSFKTYYQSGKITYLLDVDGYTPPLKNKFQRIENATFNGVICYRFKKTYIKKEGFKPMFDTKSIKMLLK